MSVANIVVKTLEEHGVSYVFGVPGEEVEDILFALQKSKIKFIPTRHEQGAAFMANVWGRLTGKVGVCLSTLGPGATNLVTGIADAYLDKSPVLAITGQADTGRLHKESHQYIDVSAMFKPITKWNALISNSKIAKEITTKALAIATSEKPGATHIDIPEDIAEQDSDDFTIKVKKNILSKPKAEDIVSIVSLIKKAKKPVFFVGNGVMRMNASEVLTEIAEKYNIPVITTFMGKGAVSDELSISLGSLGLKAKDVPGVILDSSDLVICVGYDIAEIHPSVWNNGNKKIIHIDSEDFHIYREYDPEVSVVANVKVVLEDLATELRKSKIKKYSSWFSSAREYILSQHKSYSDDSRITTPLVLNILRSVMKKNDILISDVGSHKMWIGRNFKVFKPNTCIISNGLASMGIALPGGIGAKLAKPNVRVVSVMGDGGFLMNSQEIETAKRMGIPFVIIVLNDNDYGLISWKQKTSKGKSFGTKLSNPDFVAYAKSFGIEAYHPKNKLEIKETLKHAIDSLRLCLVVIDIDPSVNLELSQKLGQNLKFKI